MNILDDGWQVRLHDCPNVSGAAVEVVASGIRTAETRDICNASCEM